MQLNGETNFLFKFVNNTNNEIFEVQLEATFFKPIGGVDGKNMESKDIQLFDNYILHVPQKNPSEMFNLHAKWMRTTEDIESGWVDKSSFIRLKITAKHSLSGLSKVFIKDFDSKSCITAKEFCTGDNLGVK